MATRRIARTADTLPKAVYSSVLQNAKVPERLYNLSVGDTHLPPPAVVIEATVRATSDPNAFQYPPTQGMPVFLDAIEKRLASRYGARVERDELQVTAGSTSGLAVVMQTLLDPGDEVLVPAPYWPLIRGAIDSRGGVPVEIPFFDRLDDPRFDPEAELVRHITPRTAALYFNSPNNPSGTIADRAVLDAVARVAKRHDLWLVLDETYEDLAFADVPPPIWIDSDARSSAIVAHTLSKTYGIAGQRVGFLHGPRDVMAAVRGVHTFQMYSASRIAQIAGARALLEADAWVEDVKGIYAAAARATAEALAIPTPKSGSFAFVDGSPFFRPGEDIMGFLARCLEAGVLLAPGHLFGRAYASWTRICFTCVPPDELRAALHALTPLFVRPASDLDAHADRGRLDL